MILVRDLQQRVLRLAAVLGVSCMGACGGGSSDSGGSMPPPAPSGLSYPAPPVFVVNEAIRPLTPSVTGSVASYSVSPALPAGLSLNTMTGVISGTPTKATGWTDYVITANNASGSTRGNVSFQILNGLYLSSYYTFTAGVNASVMPLSAGEAGTPVWSVTPALPAGLAFSTSNGNISGIPTAAAASATYVVSAATSGGTSTSSLTLAVVAAPMLDLGHAAVVSFARFSNSSLLTQDDAGHWILWNYATGQNLAHGNSPVSTINPAVGNQPEPVDLEGPTAVIQTSNGLEVRAAADGHVLSEIATTPSWWRLASDGSYLSAGSASGLTVWSPGGTVLLTRSGNYSNAVAFAAAAQLQLAQGAAGANVIETVTVPGGASTTGPAFQGQFQSWFLDGGRYFTALNNTVWVYSSASVQQDLASLPTLGQLTGQGNWYWTVTGCCASTLTLYAVGSKGTPTNTYPVYTSGVPGAGANNVSGVAVASPSTASVAILLEGTTADTGQVTLLDLSGASPSVTSSTTPIDQLNAFAASSATTWIVGNAQGVLYDGVSAPTSPRYLDYGAATAITGSLANAVVATASGRIVYFDASTLALQGTINQRAWQLAESTDGSVLAAASGASTYSTTEPPLGISVYSLPGATVSNTFTTPLLTSIALSGGGTVLEQGFVSTAPTGPCISQGVALPSGATLWCGTLTAGISGGPLSPDGTLVATAASAAVQSPPTSNIFHNDALVSAVAGAAVVWVDNDTLLTNNLVYNSMTMIFEYTSANLFDATGHLKGSPPLPQLGPVQPISATLLYDGPSNAIYSLTTGAAVWSSGSPIDQQIVLGPNGSPPSGALESAVSGSYVVFESGNLILAEPYAH